MAENSYLFLSPERIFFIIGGSSVIIWLENFSENKSSFFELTVQKRIFSENLFICLMNNPYRNGPGNRIGLIGRFKKSGLRFLTLRMILTIPRLKVLSPSSRPNFILFLLKKLRSTGSNEENKIFSRLKLFFTMA